ncbi:MAG: GNAT family N-acetyltransferase [Burkholderiales bacterium]|nr:GNAT family N-acetyltransferase [Burkholderiales bacterium]
MLEEQILNPARHDRLAFASGVFELDDYLRHFAFQQSKKKVSVVRVLVDTDAPTAILGYYSLSAAQVDAVQLDHRAQQKLPRYPVPCFRMGRFAVDAPHHGRGYGRFLLGCAVLRCLEARKHVAAYALLVDAKDAKAKALYEHYGFIPCRDLPMALYLPLGAQAL